MKSRPHLLEDIDPAAIKRESDILRAREDLMEIKRARHRQNKFIALTIVAVILVGVFGLLLL